jgi:glycosyltransferase involved in cell wall biosynthesis
MSVVGVGSSRRLHVLHVATATAGGAAEVTAAYLRDQVDRGWTVALACPSLGDLGYAAREAGAQVHWWERSTLPMALGRLRDIVTETRPDVVHLHGGRAGLVGRLVVRDRLPTLHQPGGWGFAAPRMGLALRWERYAARWTSELLLGSLAERRAAELHGIAAPVTVLPPGVDLARFRPADRHAARLALGLPDVPTVVCVGDLGVRHGQQDLLADWPPLLERVPDAHLVLVGDGPDRDALERLAPASVTFAGARTDVPQWLAAADVVAVPSRWSGTALVPVEAMAGARSVVATDVGGASEVVASGAGAVVPADDGPAMVEALARRLLAPALADEEGRVGRGRAETRHDVATSARELARVYLRLVGARRGRAVLAPGRDEPVQ